MKFSANSSIDMFSDVYFYIADPSSIISASKTKISIYDPDGRRQDYLGSFQFSSSELNWQRSSLSGFRQYKDGSNSVLWEAKDLKISGQKYYEYSTSDDGSALVEYALRGNDEITGSNENDFLYGGKGDDTIIGRSGNDTLFGGTGKDSLIGGNGTDTYLFAYDYYTNTKSPASTIRDFSDKDKEKIAVYIEDLTPVKKVSKLSGKSGEYTVQKITNGFLMSMDSNGDKKMDILVNILGIKSFKDSYVINEAFA